MENTRLTLEQVKHNFNVGDAVTVTSDRDEYSDFATETEMLSFEGKKLNVEEIIIIDEELVHYLCVDENGVSPMLPSGRLAFIDADLVAYEEPVIDKKAIQKAFIAGLDIHLGYGECDDNMALIDMAINSVKDDSEHGPLIKSNEGLRYIVKIGDKLLCRLGDTSLRDIHTNDIEICSECGAVLLPDDECYVDHETELPLCDSCSVQCRGCGNAIASSKVMGGSLNYFCSDCDTPSLNSMSLEQFEKIDGDFTFKTVGCMLGQGHCLANGMVHCKLEGAYEKFFANRKDAYENLIIKNFKVPHAYLELNNGFTIGSVFECINASKIEPQLHCGFNANEYTTRQLLEKEFQNVPNSTHKDNLIAEALQLVETCGYTVGKAANEVTASIELTGIPQLMSSKSNFLTYVGEWMNGQDCRTGENREDGTVTYLQDGLYLYEFKTREDAFTFFFEDSSSVPYAIAEYDEELTKTNGECSFGEWEFHNGFNPLWLDSKEDTKNSFAYEVTDDDIALALQEMGLPNGDADIQEVRGFLDCDAVEHEALKSDTLEKQSANAFEEIIKQINHNF